MKVLFKKEICESHKQYIGPTRKAKEGQCRFSQKREKKTKNAETQTLGLFKLYPNGY